MPYFRRLIQPVVKLIRLVFMIVIGYGLMIIVFREAYRLELPNPAPWLIKHWPSGFRLDL